MLVLGLTLLKSDDDQHFITLCCRCFLCCHIWMKLQHAVHLMAFKHTFSIDSTILISSELIFLHASSNKGNPLTAITRNILPVQLWKVLNDTYLPFVLFTVYNFYGNWFLLLVSINVKHKWAEMRCELFLFPSSSLDAQLWLVTDKPQEYVKRF